MIDDEKTIRELIANWHRGTSERDVTAVLRLMADDVVFLVAGQPPLRGKQSFEVALRKLVEHHRIDSKGEIRELTVAGDWAYCWSQLTVTVTPLVGGSQQRRSGPALSIFRKQKDGAWVLTRDANMLVPEPTAHGA